MTIQAAKLAGKMATKTTEPLTVATSESCDSELEEGEIANDEIEIIEEVIRHPVPPPISNVKPPMQQHVIRPSTTVKRSPPPSRKFDSSLDTLSLKRSRVDGAGNISVTLFNVNVTRKHDAETKSTTKRRSTAAGRSPTRNQSRKVLPPNPIKPFNNGMQQLKDSSSNGHAERAKRPPTTREPALRPSKSESSIQSSVVNHGKPEPAKDKWVSTFESTTCCSVESMDIDSSSEDDEELGLRLAALHSVVSNSNKPKEPKEPHSDSGPSSKSPPPQPVTENPNAEETQVNTFGVNFFSILILSLRCIGEKKNLSAVLFSLVLFPVIFSSFYRKRMKMKSCSGLSCLSRWLWSRRRIWRKRCHNRQNQRKRRLPKWIQPKFLRFPLWDLLQRWKTRSSFQSFPKQIDWW